MSGRTKSRYGRRENRRTNEEIAAMAPAILGHSRPAARGCECSRGENWGQRKIALAAACRSQHGRPPPCKQIFGALLSLLTERPGRKAGQVRLRTSPAVEQLIGVAVERENGTSTRRTRRRPATGWTPPAAGLPRRRARTASLHGLAYRQSQVADVTPLLFHRPIEHPAAGRVRFMFLKEWAICGGHGVPQRLVSVLRPADSPRRWSQSRRMQIPYGSKSQRPRCER